MPNIILSVPVELHWIDILLEKSELTDEDAERIGHKIKHEMRKRFS